jgi:transcriptional regulator with XRE-family HTH domain
MKNRNEHFSAEKLIALRKRKKISQRELAKLAAISQAQVAELERGKRLPTVDVAERISRALDVGNEDLS